MSSTDELKLVLLRTINNNIEFNLIKALLEDNDIPYIVKDYGAGGYMRIIGGESFSRTEILVEESFYEKANNILEQITWEE